MQQPTAGMVPQPQMGLSAARPASAQQIQQSATSQPTPTGVPPISQGMPNSRQIMDPMILQQILGTMLGQPGLGGPPSIGALMAPQGSANPLPSVQSMMPQLQAGV